MTTILSTDAQNKLSSSTCCHLVQLEKGGLLYQGIYNGLSNWGLVENGAGNLVETLTSHREDEYDSPIFTLVDFELSGYTIA